MKQRILLIISFLLCNFSIALAADFPWSTLTRDGSIIEFNTTTKKLTVKEAKGIMFTVPTNIIYTDNKVYSVDSVDISNQPISSPLRTINLHGANIKVAICKNNPTVTDISVMADQNKSAIKYFDFSNCIKLTSILNIGTAVEYLNIEGCISLKILTCKRNNLESLDVSTCSSLQNLNCTGCEKLTNIVLPNEKNNLQTVNVSDCSSLTNLNLQSYSNLTDISVSGCDNLSNLTLPENNNKIRSLKFINIAKKSLDVSGYINLDTLVCDSSSQIEELIVPSTLKFLHLVQLSRLGQVDLSKCTKLGYLNIEETRLHEPGIDQCLNLLWYINPDGYLVNNFARSYQYARKDIWGTICWAEKIVSKDIEAYTIVGAEKEDDYYTGVYLEKVIDSDIFNVQNGLTTLEASKPYIIKFKSDTVVFRRETKNYVDTISNGNGLVGNYIGAKVQYVDGKTFGLIKGGKLWEVDKTYDIPGFSAYIDFSTITTNKKTSTFLAFDENPGGPATNIKNNTESETTDVYNILGVKLRHNVRTENATEGLPSGTYIVNGKVVVK